MIFQLLGSIIGIIILIYVLNWWKYRHLFAVDLKKEMPFTSHWFEMSEEEREAAIKKVAAENKSIKESMTEKEYELYCEEKYLIGTIHIKN